MTEIYDDFVEQSPWKSDIRSANQEFTLFCWI
jgi:hypothetical protein